MLVSVAEKKFESKIKAALLTKESDAPRPFIERLEAATAELVTDNPSFAESFTGWLFERYKKIASERRLPSRGRGS